MLRRSVLPTGTVSRKREIGFMGLVLGGRESGIRREDEREREREREALPGKLFHGAEQSKVATVQSGFLKRRSNR